MSRHLKLKLFGLAGTALSPSSGRQSWIPDGEEIVLRALVPW
jgi:hypothetical protein